MGGLPIKIKEYPSGSHITGSHFDLMARTCASSIDQGRTLLESLPAILLEPPSVNRQVEVLYDDIWYHGIITKVRSGEAYTISVKFDDGTTLRDASYPDEEGGIRLVEIEAATSEVELANLVTANNSEGSPLLAVKVGDKVFARPWGPVMDWYIPCVVEDERIVNPYGKPVTDFKCRFESVQLENLQMTKQWIPPSRMISYDCMVSSVVQALEQSPSDMQMDIVLLNVARKLKIDPAFVIAINEQFGGIIKSSLQLSSQVEINEGCQADIDNGPSHEDEPSLPFAVPWSLPDEEEVADTNEMAAEGGDNDSGLSGPPQPENIAVHDESQEANESESDTESGTLYTLLS